jgi:hypothetical protein
MSRIEAISGPLVPAKAGTQVLRTKPILHSRVCGNERKGSDQFAFVQVCALQMSPPMTQPLSCADVALVMVNEPE